MMLDEAKGPIIEDLYQLCRPRNNPPYAERLQAFGMAVYEVEFPGVACSRPSTCPAKAWTAFARDFGSMPGSIVQRAHALREQGCASIPIAEYELLFGYRQPTCHRPDGFAFVPGTRGGAVSLFFCRQPRMDVIWPREARSLFVSEKVRTLFVERKVTGAVFHTVTRAVVVPESHFDILPGCGEVERQLARQRLLEADGESASISYYEVEASPPPGDCGLRWKLGCRDCGYTIHDCKDARAQGPLLAYGGTDFFDLRGLGRPVCTKKVVEMLQHSGVEVFEAQSVTTLLEELIAEDGGEVEQAGR